jgi:hypothetical protein
MRWSKIAFICSVISLICTIQVCAQVPAVKAVPQNLPEAVRLQLERRAAELKKQYDDLVAENNAFVKKYANRDIPQNSPEAAEALQQQAQLETTLDAYKKAVIAFNKDVAEAKPEVDLLGPEGRRIVKGMNALAKQLEWSADKQNRLDKALNNLGIDPATWSDSTQIQRVWRDVLNRGQDADLVREASQGGGLGFPGAGKQTDMQDCAIFSLANAAGLPYGVVAARAAKLIRQGEWRSVDERAAPEKTIEDGLIGGEVIMLAEVFGQAEVVRSTDFAKTLKEGRPILLNVVPKGGDLRTGHEIVLTKTFQHRGETWYVMMDPYQGPQQRLFLSARELNTILKENGVAFRPEPGATPNLLRKEGDQ